MSLVKKLKVEDSLISSIENYSKQQIIRQNENISSGDTISICDKNENYIKSMVCLGVKKIEILSSKEILLDGKKLNEKLVLELAISEGFKNTDSFFDFFGKYSNKYQGELILWGLTNSFL